MKPITKALLTLLASFILLMAAVFSGDSTITPTDRFMITTPREKYIIYHLGADWCRPCHKMIDDVWSDDKVRDFLTYHKIKLVLLDSTIDEQAKYFTFFKVRAYPTIIMSKRVGSQVPILRFEGYMKEKDLMRTIEHSIINKG